MVRRVSPLLLLLVAILLAGCGAKPQAAQVKRYPMTGEIKAVDTNAKTATIDAGPIGDWMSAMTMDYPVKPDAELQKLHVGDHIQATVVVSTPASDSAPPSYYVTDVKSVK